MEAPLCATRSDRGCLLDVAKIAVGQVILGLSGTGEGGLALTIRQQRRIRWSGVGAIPAATRATVLLSLLLLLTITGFHPNAVYPGGRYFVAQLPGRRKHMTHPELRQAFCDCDASLLRRGHFICVFRNSPDPANTFLKGVVE